MPVKTSVEAIFGAAVVYHSEELCRAEAHMVTSLQCLWLVVVAAVTKFNLTLLFLI